jgi:hypothetical protein
LTAMTFLHIVEKSLKKRWLVLMQAYNDFEI